MSGRVSPSPRVLAERRISEPISPVSEVSQLPLSDVPPSSLHHTVPRLGDRSDRDALIGVEVAAGNLSQFLASCIVIEKQTEDWMLLLVYQSLELMSFFSVIYLAQWTSHLFLLLVLMIMYCMAAVREGQWYRPLLQPIYLFVPEFHSWFGLSHKQHSAMVYQICAATLRLGSLALWVALIPLEDHEEFCVVPVTDFEDSSCQEVPAWLSSGCGTFFAPKQWQRCVATTSWLKYGYCNLLAAQCRNQSLSDISLPISIFFNSSMSLLSVLAPLLWLASVLWLSWRKGFCIFNTPKNVDLSRAVSEMEINLAEDLTQVFAGASLHRLMLFDLILTITDLVSDVLVFFVFAMADNWTFALLQLLVIVSGPCLTSAVLLKKKELKAWKEVAMQLWKAYESRVFTEEYLNLAIMERTRRCPLSLFLQVYGSMFVTSNILVASIFSLGIFSSLLSTVQGVLLHIHLDLDAAVWSFFV